MFFSLTGRTSKRRTNDAIGNWMASFAVGSYYATNHKPDQAASRQGSFAWGHSEPCKTKVGFPLGFGL